MNPFIIDCTLVDRAYGAGQIDCGIVNNNDYHVIPKVYVYPNPINDFISFRGLKTNGDSIVIHDIHGNFIQKIDELIANYIDVSGYMAGIYVITMYRKGKKIDSMKFVKS